MLTGIDSHSTDMLPLFDEDAVGEQLKAVLEDVVQRRKVGDGV
jgi:hypothetical protein